eukprot:gene11227-biopygen7834
MSIRGLELRTRVPDTLVAKLPYSPIPPTYYLRAWSARARRFAPRLERRESRGTLPTGNMKLPPHTSRPARRRGVGAAKAEGVRPVRRRLAGQPTVRATRLQCVLTFVCDYQLFFFCGGGCCDQAW